MKLETCALTPETFPSRIHGELPSALPDSVYKTSESVIRKRNGVGGGMLAGASPRPPGRGTRSCRRRSACSTRAQRVGTVCRARPWRPRRSPPARVRRRRLSIHGMPCQKLSCTLYLRSVKQCLVHYLVFCTVPSFYHLTSCAARASGSGDGLHRHQSAGGSCDRHV